jgi:hypothetical protein
MKLLALAFVIVPAAVGCAMDPPDAPPSGEPSGEPSGAIESASAVTVPVYMNHAIGVFSQATIDALQTDRYLNDTFVDVEVRTTVRPDITYTGTYLNTRFTYLETFADGMLGLTRNVYELATGTEAAGSSEQVQQAWNAEFGEHQTAIPTISRDRNGVQVPWFRLVVPEWSNAAATTAVFNLEYVPDPGSSIPRTREQERAARYQPAKLAQDIQAVLFAGPVAERELLRRALAVVGWTTIVRSDGFLALSPRDHGTRRAILVVDPQPGRAGMLGVVFRLNRLARHTEQLGDAQLHVGSLGLPFATLWFVPPSAADEATLVNAIAQ